MQNQETCCNIQDAQLLISATIENAAGGDRHVQRWMCREAYIKNQHANCKRGLDNLHQEVNADRVEAEAALRVLAEMHQHRLQACIMQIASVGSVHAAGLNMANNLDV